MAATATVTVPSPHPVPHHMHRHSHPGQHASQCALPGCHARLALENTVTTTEGQRPTALARLVLGSASPHPAREVGPEFGQLGVSHHRPPATHPPGIEPAGTSPSAPVLVIPAAAHNAALSLTRRSPKRNQSTEAWREGESGGSWVQGQVDPQGRNCSHHTTDSSLQPQPAHRTTSTSASNTSTNIATNPCTRVSP